MLAYAGLRIGELLALDWRDVDLATGRITVRASKTEAGVRVVDVQPELRGELLTWKMASGGEGLVFGTSTGKPDSRNNVRRWVLVRAVERANENGAELPVISPHALRRSYISWLIFEGEDPAYVMAQAGHADAKFTLSVYAKAVASKSRRASGQRALTGTSGDLSDLAAPPATTEREPETAQ